MKMEKNQDVYLALGEKISCVLKELGVSHRELFAAAGMSNSTLQKCLKKGMLE